MKKNALGWILRNAASPSVQIEEDFPKLYKYTRSEWADEMVAKGRMRIGTLYQYRLSTQKEIGDQEEGTKSYVFSGNPSSIRTRVRDFLQGRPDIKPMHGKDIIETNLSGDVPVGVTQHVPDVYLFCMTQTLDETVMRSFGYDACVEIFNPRRFYEAVAESMLPYSPAWVLRKCKYVERWAEWDKHCAHEPDVMKPVHLKHQNEVRLIYASYQELINPTDLRPLEHVDIENRTAGRYCRRII